MVELSGADSPFQHRFSNSVFIVPAVIVVGLTVFFGYKLYKSLVDREQRRAEKQKAKQNKKKK